MGPFTAPLNLGISGLLISDLHSVFKVLICVAYPPPPPRQASVSGGRKVKMLSKHSGGNMKDGVHFSLILIGFKWF